jgi:hypothetical protein
MKDFKKSIKTSDGTVYSENHPEYDKIHNEWISMKNSKDWQIIFIPEDKNEQRT